MKTKILVSLMAIFLGVSSQASDHIDGPITTATPHADLADLYFFPSPAKPNHTVMVVNTHFAAYEDNHFNQGLVYTFHVSEADVIFDSREIDHHSVVEINCTFDVPPFHGHHHDHTVTCVSDNGLIATGNAESVVEGDGITAFAGLRSDPFFFNFWWVKETLDDGVIPAPENNDIMNQLNALSIVLEVDMAKLFPRNESPRYGLAASVSTLEDDNKTVIEQLDWVARPEITNVTMAARGREDIRDEYNTQEPFSIGVLEWSKYHQRIVDNVLYFDGIDNDYNWTTTDVKAFASILMNDALVLDLTLPCLDDNYMNIEKAVLNKEEPTSCGGRQLQDDFVDVIYTYYVNKDQGDVIRDGVDAPHKATLDEFPYLNEPTISWGAWWAMKKARAAAYFAN